MTGPQATCASCPRDLLPTETGRAACRVCARRMTAALREIPRHLPLLAASLAPAGRGIPTGTRRTSAAHPALGVAVGVLSLTGPAAPGDVHDPHHDQTGTLPIAGRLAPWAWRVAEAGRGPDLPPRATVTTLCTWLAPHIDWACHFPWVSELADELRDLVAELRRITRTEPRRQLLTGPCLCGAFALVREDWAAYIECEVCGRLLSEEEYADHTATVLPGLTYLAVAIATAPHQTAPPA